MDRGFYKVWRKQEDSAFWSMGAMYRGVWVTMLHRANWREAWFLGFKIGPGEFACSVESLAEDAKVSRQTLRTILDRFKAWGMITTQNLTNRATKVSICNWATYNGTEQTKQPTINQPLTNHQPTANQPLTTIKEGKKERREEEREHAHESATIAQPPTLKDCIATGTVAGIPEQFSRDWHAMMEAQCWRDNNGRPCAFRWRNLLKKYHETEKANPTAPKTGGLFA